MKLVMDERKTAVIEHNDKLFRELYEQCFPAVARFVSKMNGSFDDARDIFHDALIVYYEKTHASEFISESVEAYLVGISKHLWIRKFKSEHRLVSFTDSERLIEIPENFFPEPRTKMLLRFLERTGEKCLELLRSFYFEKDPMKLLAGRMGYRTIHSATVQKYKCLEKLRDLVKEKSLSYEDFLD
jgi:DNA-directed RNA polymerase specialized sigma24 family protein